MTWWLFQVGAFLGTVALSTASGISIPKRLRTATSQVSFSSRPDLEASNAFDPAFIYVEFLNRCSGASLDMDSCLVSSTVSAFMGMENGRKLQQEEEGCTSGPDINEELLRLVMDVSKAQCIASDVSISDAEFEITVAGFMTIFSSTECFCADDAASQLLLMEITLDAAADCAQVELDMPQCLKDHVLLYLTSSTPDISSNVGVQRKLQDSTSTCEQSYLLNGLAMYAATMLEDGKVKCAAQDISVGTDQLLKAHSDLVSVFSAQQCWGVNSDTDCEVVTSDDDIDSTSGGGINGLGVAIRYIEQCAGVDINMDSCLTSTSISALLPVAFAQSQPSRERLLQLSDNEPECMAPKLSDLTLRYIVGESALKCSSKGIDASEEEIEQTVNNFIDFFGAQECWVALCEEQTNPSEEMYKLLFEEIAQCAGAHFNWNPCLLDQLFELLVSSGPPNASLEGVRRKLQVTFEPCASSESSEAEFTFVVNMLLAGAEQNCVELGETVSPADVAEAQVELLKLFTAQQCWGAASDCAVPENDYRFAYLKFVEERISMMLGECVGAEAITCVFSRSIEVMQGMELLGWSVDGHSDLAQVDDDLSTLCVPPAISEVDVGDIAKHAQAYCVASGIPALDSDDYSAAIEGLHVLVSETSCWDDLCQPDIKNFITGEWIEYCTSLNLEFLLAQVQSNTALDIEMVECMVNYILPTGVESFTSLTCEPPLPGLGVCGHEIGEEAYVQCGGEITLPATTTTPSMQFSMSFSFDDWFPPEGNGPEVDAYINEACNVIQYLHSNMTMSCLQPVCDGLWIEDTLTVDNGVVGEDDDSTDDKSTIVETPQPTKQPTPRPSTKPTPSSSSKPTPPATRSNGSIPSSGRFAAFFIAVVLVFSSLMV